MYYAKKLKKINYINHCFFSRNGGYSKQMYRSLNCGRGSRDSKNNIKKKPIFNCKENENKSKKSFINASNT